nr:energy transducer TonB [Ramlibacter henchirensis]
MSDLRRHRNTAIATGVVLFHAAALWALQSGLLRRAVEVIVPVEVLAQIVEPPQPKIDPPAPPPPRPQPPAPAPPPKPAPVRKVQPPPPPKPMAVPSPVPAPQAPVGVTTPQPPAPPIPAPVAEAPPAPPAPPAPAAPPRIELPSSSAEYLQNPPPAYPAMSRRLGEQGQVMVRVLIGADGSAQQAQVTRSSGYERLDQAALNAVLKWRYVPGKRGGVPEAMWFNVPINFVLE